MYGLKRRDGIRFIHNVSRKGTSGLFRGHPFLFLCLFPSLNLNKIVADRDTRGEILKGAN